MDSVAKVDIVVGPCDWMMSMMVLVLYYYWYDLPCADKILLRS